MLLRKAQSTDENQLVRIYESFYSNDFPLDLTTAYANVVAEEDGKILGFGWLDVVTEANIILDLEAQQRKKFEALRGIINTGVQVAKQNGMKQIHAFPRDAKFADILEKHLNFSRITTECLVRNLGESNG